QTVVSPSLSDIAESCFAHFQFYVCFVRAFISLQSLTVLLSICLLLVSSAPLAFAAEDNKDTSPVLNERIISILEKNNIGFEISEGSIKLLVATPESITEVNKLISSGFKNSPDSASIAAAYPTPYTHMKQYDIYNSQKFQAATKTALAAAVIEWAKNKLIPDPLKISVAAVGGFGAYYFINSDKEDLYFYIKYSYRELGPGFFDHNGTFIGDYEILKEIRVTKNSNYTGGNRETDARRSSVVEPWF
ncbi:hypothetical protein, partial [Paenibacillus medicaginis]